MTVAAVLEMVRKYGLQVFPLHSVVDGQCTCKNKSCGSPGKHPLIRANWKNIATSDPARLQRWFSDYERLNYAVATGRKLAVDQERWLVVVDVDSESHPIVQRLTKTFFYQTGGGGYHFWYWSNTPLKNSVAIQPKVDIRGTNGYVVIPPSKHKSGGRYSIHPETITEITELPAFIHELLAGKQQTEEKPRERGTSGVLKKEPADPEVKRAFDSKSVEQIRLGLSSGNQVPVGARNVVLHRLLSSDRAKGELSKTVLLEKAGLYLSCFEDPGSFSPKELMSVVGSVMKYPAYNSSFEKVNEAYVKWLQKQGLKIPEGFLHDLTAADTQWFQTLDKGLAPGVSLADLMLSRRIFMTRSLGHGRISEYKPALLGKKLRSLGFERRRTAKDNKWLIAVADHANMDI